jgi:hypothetical protein
MILKRRKRDSTHVNRKEKLTIPGKGRQLVLAPHWPPGYKNFAILYKLSLVGASPQA